MNTISRQKDYLVGLALFAAVLAMVLLVHQFSQKPLITDQQGVSLLNFNTAKLI
ncbi:hypothetical protein [Sediminibacterium ginsengisoli]|uniref:Uncharacterized protein n=1 Tax=Sediminibacterium ginsengisoli TaxID=413434 RepID=A0A1T4PIX3_9BACT|nr:hypothetical protein [Sediminibacterium ginsengisoli]SJZ91449.1 hypothetical protein SAMN04488132_10638 [Sediminibacterium ginsengisoli]